MSEATVADVAAVIGTARFGHLYETGLQEGIADVLRDAFPDAHVEREVRIGRRERIDLMVGRIGVEVKIAGAASAVRRQLARYATSGAVDALILVSTRVTHCALSGVIGGIPVTVVTPRWL